jgi:hypothetical protein
LPYRQEKHSKANTQWNDSIPNAKGSRPALRRIAHEKKAVHNGAMTIEGFTWAIASDVP